MTAHVGLCVESPVIRFGLGTAVRQNTHINLALECEHPGQLTSEKTRELSALIVYPEPSDAAVLKGNVPKILLTHKTVFPEKGLGTYYGVLPLSVSTETLCAAIHTVASRIRYIHKSIQIQPLGTLSDLTPRELEVFSLLAHGNTVKAISVKLNLSVKTVEAHKCNLMKKLGIHKSNELVVLAIKAGIVDITA